LLNVTEEGVEIADHANAEPLQLRNVLPVVGAAINDVVAAPVWYGT
jgi:hypothetical protein